MTALIVSVHDVAPSTFIRSRRIVDILESRSIRASLLVVPGYWQGDGPISDDEFATWLKQAQLRGHEIVQHGTNHQATTTGGWLRFRVGRFIGRGCEEFWGLTFTEAYELALEGRRRLQKVGLHPQGFISPAWLSSRGAMRAISELGYDYSTTHTKVIDFSASRSIRSIALSQRPGSDLSLVAAVVVRLVGMWLAWRSKIVRVAIHPGDLDSTVATWSSLATIDFARRSGLQAITYGELIARTRSSKSNLPFSRIELRLA